MKLKILNTAGLTLVIYVNYLANALPLNGYNTGELSDFYPNLFVPAGVTFSIWGIIYLFLIGFVIAQWFPKFSGAVSRIGYLFLANCLLNCSWIFAWHYRLEEVSLVIMLLLLYSLIKLHDITQANAPQSLISQVFLKIPFSIYFGWICVATIANFTTLLVHWDFNPPYAAYWAAALIAITQVLVWIINSKYCNLFYTLTIIWAIGGIILKQNNLAGPDVIVYTGYTCIASSVIIYLYHKLKPSL